ncbi:hypothetical protein O7626_23050 [Micromonospora sp. WMMD1102]|nr:hypothetical protein [Micromonospora sp. WMMD1102]MDG4788766.1 hypothetical protein [Micromonospora sp. WMMD1102]
MSGPGAVAAAYGGTGVRPVLRAASEVGPVLRAAAGVGSVAAEGVPA